MSSKERTARDAVGEQESETGLAARADGKDTRTEEKDAGTDGKNAGTEEKDAGAAEAIRELRAVIDRLLGPGGCPWDQQQTPLSLCDYVIEEGYELVEGIRAQDPDMAREELGDVLFLLLFIARLYERSGDFSLEGSVRENAAKMIRRHPHVFGDLEIKNQEELLKNWERIKRNEHADAEDKPAGVFDSLPSGLPPLLKAYRIHSKAARVGFTWKQDADVVRQMESEWAELQEARASGDPERVEAEFGDYLFTLAEYGRRLGVKANAALDRTNITFLSRFRAMESLARAQGKDIAELTLDEQDALWREAKKAEEA